MSNICAFKVSAGLVLKNGKNSIQHLTNEVERQIWDLDNATDII